MHATYSNSCSTSLENTNQISTSHLVALTRGDKQRSDLCLVQRQKTGRADIKANNDLKQRRCVALAKRVCGTQDNISLVLLAQAGAATRCQSVHRLAPTKKVHLEHREDKHPLR